MANKLTLLYHWSPVERRQSIKRQGLKPGSRSLNNLWRPPYVCLSPSPSQAWGLRNECEEEFPEWDLWTVWSNRIGKHTITREDGAIKEYRVYERIYKRDLWFVGTRSATTSGWRD